MQHSSIGHKKILESLLAEFQLTEQTFNGAFLIIFYYTGPSRTQR